MAQDMKLREGTSSEAARFEGMGLPPGDVARLNLQFTPDNYVENVAEQLSAPVISKWDRRRFGDVAAGDDMPGRDAKVWRIPSSMLLGPSGDAGSATAGAGGAGTAAGAAAGAAGAGAGAVGGTDEWLASNLEATSLGAFAHSDRPLVLNFGSFS